MPRLRLPLQAWMAILVYLAIALAALRQGTPIWATLIHSIALVMLTVAGVAAAASRGRRRAGWLGFVLAGWPYYLLCFSDLLSRDLQFFLATTVVLDLVPKAIADVSSRNSFLIGHSLFTCLIGLGGSWLALVIADQEQPDRP